jgi:hypothetical protein
MKRVAAGFATPTVHVADSSSRIFVARVAGHDAWLSLIGVNPTTSAMNGHRVSVHSVGRTRPAGSPQAHPSPDDR